MIFQLKDSPLEILKGCACAGSTPIGGYMSKLKRAAIRVFSDSVLCLRKAAVSEAPEKFTRKWVDHCAMKGDIAEEASHQPQGTVILFQVQVWCLPWRHHKRLQSGSHRLAGTAPHTEELSTQSHAHEHDERNTYFPQRHRRTKLGICDLTGAACFGEFKTG